MMTEADEILEQADRLPSDEQEEDWLDVFSLNHAPPLDSYVIKVKFVDGGIGQPRRYDFGDIFDDEEEGEEEAEPLDVFSLKWVPPESSFVIQARFVDAGIGEPARYDFSEIFDDEEGSEE